MAALAAERDISRKGLGTTATIAAIPFKVKAATKIWRGAMVAVDATGYLVPASGAVAAHRVVGVAQETVDNTSGASGDKVCEVLRGTYPFANSSAGDAITITEISKTVYVVDDQTVAKTDNTGARPPAGVLWGFDEAGLPLVETGIRSATGV